MDTLRDFLQFLETTPGVRNLGLANARIEGTLTFLDSPQFTGQLVRNSNIVAVVTTESLGATVAERRPDVAIHQSESPRALFYRAHNHRAQGASDRLGATQIAPSARVDQRAHIAPRGVVVGPDVVIEPNVTIMPGVQIGARSVIRAGSSLGVEGFEHKRVPGGVLSVHHDRYVIIGDDVEIGANCTIARGLMGEDTCIGSQTKTDCLVHIAHSAKVGSRCLIAAHAVIAGSAVIGDDVWIGPNASISSQVQVGHGAFVTLGAVVVRDVGENERVTGNFAIAHRDFLTDLMNQARVRKRREGPPC
jgi:UDP-3-O-[3-hydroxymyristoyl] glucosamine N-acyltransferase